MYMRGLSPLCSEWWLPWSAKLEAAYVNYELVNSNLASEVMDSHTESALAKTLL